MLGTGGRADLNTDTAERIATDINQLNFVLWKMKVGYPYILIIIKKTLVWSGFFKYRPSLFFLMCIKQVFLLFSLTKKSWITPSPP